jgi:hypothetical protein
MVVPTTAVLALDDQQTLPVIGADRHAAVCGDAVWSWRWSACLSTAPRRPMVAGIAGCAVVALVVVSWITLGRMWTQLHTDTSASLPC